MYAGGGDSDRGAERGDRAAQFDVISTILSDMDKTENMSAIAKAKAANDGRLLTRAHAIERRKLQEHGAAEGLDKYKPNGIRVLKKAEDFLAFKEDALKDTRQFKGGLELIHFNAFLNWKRYGLEPSPEVLASLSDAVFDPFLATPEENAPRLCVLCTGLRP